MTIMNDPCYPQIPQVIDMELMAKVLETLFTANQPEKIVVESCNIKNQRHKAGKSFVISYDLILFNMQTNGRRSQIVGGRLCKPGQDQLELEQEREKHTKDTDTVSTVVYLPEVEMLVWVFPQDRKLIHLPRIMNADFLKARLAGILRLLGCSGSSHIEDVQMEVLHYLPERSCMIRYRLTIDDPVSDTKLQKIIYGKNYRDNNGGEIHSIMCQLATQLPKTAIPLGYDEQHRTLWQSHLPGIPLEWSDLETSKAKGLLKNMAACVTAFQGCQIKTTGYYGFKEIDDQLFETVKSAESQDKLLSGQLSFWVSALIAKREVMSWPDTVARPLHQDLHLGNFMMDEDSLCLIDLDTACLGDPLADIGSLVANFYRRGLNAGQNRVYVDNIVNQFLRYYMELISWKIGLSQLNWFIAAAFVHEVIRRILRQRHEIGLKHIQTFLDLSKHYAGLIVEELESA